MKRRFNVMVRVLDLVDADTPEEAMAKLKRRVEAAGFDTYELATPDPSDCFETPVPPASADPLGS